MATYPTPSSISDMAPPDNHDMPVGGAASEEQGSDQEEAASGEKRSDQEAKDNVDETEGETDREPRSKNEKDSEGSDAESNWDFASKSEYGPGDLSYDKLLEWWNKTNGCGDELNAISKRLFKIKTARTVNWKRELKGVITNVDKVLRLRNEAKDALEADDESSSTGPEDNMPIRTICHPKLCYVPWKRIQHWRFSSRSYPAIEIPSDKAPDHFFEVVAPSRSSRFQSTMMPYHPHVGFPDLPPPDELPNRIRINSIRLQRLLIHERRAIGDSIAPEELSGDTNRLILYKPYKILAYLETRIRDRLRRFEDTRNTKFQGMSEEEYMAAYNQDPVTDEFFHLLPVLEDKLGLNELSAWINDCRCLVEFMDRFMVPERTRIANAVTAAASIQFSDLWHAFPVGSLVYIKDENYPQKVWRVSYTYFGRQHFDFNLPYDGDKMTPRPATFFVWCYYLEYDGTRYIPISHRFQIRHWEGYQAFSSVFPLVPFTVAGQDESRKDGNREKLVERGQKYIEYASKPRLLYYSGRSQSLTPSGIKLVYGDPEERNKAIQHSVRIDSPVMVDLARGFQEVSWWRPESLAINSMTTNMDRNMIILGALAPTNNLHPGHPGHPGNSYPPPPPPPPPNYSGPARPPDETVVDADQIWDRRIRDDHFEHESKKWRAWEGGGQPTQEDDILLLPARVIAFVFRTRKWANLDLGENMEGTESLTEMVTRAEPWRDLKLPEGHKEVVQSLITWHFNPNKALNPHFDLVRDKGKGVIILLHGVPGVGKTSTAECAAESNGRPLFPITCGDLGLTPQDVETKLDEIFRLAQAWGCILLLDEADVFLAQRTTSDIQRNALVSVFLRTLEHYEGILFLTTNRVGVFDEAFKSRIHISLYYPSLDQLQTYQIWETHIKKAIEAGIHVDRDDLINFAVKAYENQKDPKSGPVWNGRQIRNAFQSALALAGFHANPGAPLKLERQHFQKVFTASDKFSNYIWRVRQGHTDADWNKMHMVRRDDFNYVSPPGLDVMNNAIVPQGPYGGFSGGQSASSGGPGSFPQSTFGQNFGLQPGMQPQIPAMFGTANQFQQFAQAQYQQPSVAAQTHPTANFGPQQQQQQQQQAVPSHASTVPTQYNPLQTGQFGQNTMPQQQNTLQQDGNYALFAQQQNHLAGIALQSSINLQPNPQALNPAQRTQQQTGAGFMTPEAAVAAQQQATGGMQVPSGHGQQGTAGMGSGL